MKTLLAAVEKNKQLILDTERYIWKHPETGYKEKKTSQYLAEIFQSLGYDLVFADGITGFYTTIDTGRPGPVLMVLGEMDSVICPGHKDADPETGAVHACGHHVQCAALVGIAAALKEPGALDSLSGKIKLCAVPAEETVEIDFRNQLKAEGVIKHFGGKSEFLYRGYFDDVNLAFMVHAATTFHVRLGSVGCLVKKVTYKGRASHAGNSPWNGINALYAANCGLNAINAIRETFEEKDVVRVHPIITNGGAIVNAIPEQVTLESYVRGASFEGIAKNNRKVNRALCGAALSLGANVDITDYSGYGPLLNDRNLVEVAKEAAALALPEKEFEVRNRLGSGSTDMGDLSSVMPVVQPYISGAAGKCHGSDYRIEDPQTACVGGAKFQLAMIYLLLSNDAQRAKTVVAESKPPFASKEEYFAYLDSLVCSGDRIQYGADGSATVDLR